MSENDTPQRPGAIDRREALKRAAQIAGVAAFATPVVAGVFSAPAMAQVPSCTVEGDSDAVPGIFVTGSSWNQNCASISEDGRYNGQDHNFTISGGQGTVQVGNPGNDNFPTSVSFYVIDPPPGFTRCTATFVYAGCAVTTQLSNPIGIAPPGALPVPFCPNACPPTSNGTSGRLVLQSVTCCP